MAARTIWLSALLATAVGCGSQPPPSIPVDEALAVIEPLEPSVQSCGESKWDGDDWAFSSFYYSGKVKTPWLRRPTDIDATIVGGGRERFLVGMTIDGHEYRRDSRTEKVLTWRRYLAEAP